MAQNQSFLAWCLAIAAALAGCDGGNDDGPPTGSPARLSIVSGNGQTAEQHLRIPQDLVVALTDRDGQPVNGISVEFTPAPGSPEFRTDWPLKRTSNPGLQPDGIHWFAFFHTPGPHRIVAKVAGLPPVAFDVNVTPSTHQYDGFYLCDVGGRPVSVMTIVHGAQPGHPGNALEEFENGPLYIHGGAIDEATGAMQATIKTSLETRIVLRGQMVVDSSGQPSGSGTWDLWYHDQPPSLQTGTWTCSRF